jgi:hypothetical protein
MFSPDVAETIKKVPAETDKPIIAAYLGGG